ncbi:MAG: cation:proton antiporter [Herminiimonas sp.]|nr:cation:proton antiporter [Herminiimonas sp.]
MPEQHALPYLKEILIFLVLAGILIPFLRRFRINKIMGFLAAGALVGPFGLGLWTARFPWLDLLTITDIKGVQTIAELGILFLMFMIGLELPPGRLWSLRRWVFGAGAVQVVLSAAMIAALAYLFGNRLETSVILGLALSLSSTAVVVKVLNDRRALGSPLGQASFSILMFQDLAVVPLFILVGVLTTGFSNALLPLVAVTLAKSVATIVLVYLLGRFIIRPLFRAFGGMRQPDAFMALTLLSCVGVAAITAEFGLPMALGAFLGGLMLADTGFKHDVEVTVEPFRGLLMGLFFISVGMQVDVRVIASAPLLIPLSVVGLFLVKGMVTTLVFRVGRFTWGRAAEAGLLLGQGGEFAFIIVGMAMTSRLLDAAAGQFILIVVSFSIFATPLAANLGQVIATWWEQRYGEHAGKLADTLPGLAGHVVIAGFGRVGQLVAQILARQGIAYVALETDASMVAKFHSQGMPVYSGDASRAALLDKVHAAQARAIVLTMNDARGALEAVRAIRSQGLDVPLLTRAGDEKHALALKGAGATMVVLEMLESSLQLSESVLQLFGYSEQQSARLIQIERDLRIGTPV